MHRERFELTELGLNIRHWENLRWVSMTVFIAVMGGLGALALGAGGITVPKALLPFTKWAGLVMVAIFWIQDERIVAYWLSFRNRAVQVESVLGARVFTSGPKRGFISAGTAVRVLYLGFAISWLLLIWHS